MKAELESRLDAPEMSELLHPGMSDVRSEKVRSLCLALQAEDSHTGTTEAIRALVEAIVLEPDSDRLKITLKGDLAGMLSAARDSKRSPDTGDPYSKLRWLRRRTTSGTCSCGAGRRDTAPLLPAPILRITD
jgi:hypothetical protein